MILVDRNVVSEVMRPAPAREVLDWFEAPQTQDLYFSAVSEAELRTGAAFLPAGRRRERLMSLIDAMIEEDFAGRALPFDGHAARAYAEIAFARRGAGRPVMHADCQIAAIARAHGAAVATRNVGDFEGCGIEVIDPWTTA